MSCSRLCPTSNLHTHAVEGLEELKHIVQTFFDRGVKVTINTDGPYLLDTDMHREVELIEKNGIMTPGPGGAVSARLGQGAIRSSTDVPASPPAPFSAVARGRP